MYAVLSREGAGLNLEFLQRIRKWQRKIEVVIGIVMHGSIEKVSHSRPQAAADRDTLSSRHTPGGVAFYCDGSSGKRDEVRHLTPIQGQLKDPLILDDLTDTTRAGLNQCGVCLNFDLFAELSNLKSSVDDRVAVDLQHN